MVKKVNQFEKGSSDPIPDYPFSIESNLHYRVKDLGDLTANNYQHLKELVNHFVKNQIPRLQVLDDYSKGRNTYILNMTNRTNENKSDYRIAHNFGKLISQFVAGYTTSQPLKYSIKDSDKDTNKHQKIIDDFNKDNNISTLDNELMYDVAKYGRAYDIQYRTVDNSKKTKDNIMLSNVFETFVIYDQTLERNPIAGVRVEAHEDLTKKRATQYEITLYTDKRIIKFEKTNLRTNLQVVKDKGHLYGKIPVVEYQSNRYRTSWYEDVIDLIDAYDSSESDTSNYMTDVINSLLVLSGDFSANGITIDKLIKQIKDYGVLGLQSGYNPTSGTQTNVGANYISPNLDSGASETYKQRIRKDIFNISNIPDMSDESFGGVQSGVAMRYKIFGFEQAIGQTINAFKQSVNNRYDVYFGILKNVNHNGDFPGVDITITPNLPYAVSEEVDMLNSVGVPVSRKTMYEQVHFTTPEAEENNLENESDNKSDKKLDNDLKNIETKSNESATKIKESKLKDNGKPLPPDNNAKVDDKSDE